MNKDKEIERLKKQISKLREENRQLKSEARIAKRKATKADKKRRHDNNIQQRTRTVVVRPVKGHRFSELAIRLSSVIYSNVGCGLRSVVKLLEIIDETFGGIFQGAVTVAY